MLSKWGTGVLDVHSHCKELRTLFNLSQLSHVSLFVSENELVAVLNSCAHQQELTCYCTICCLSLTTLVLRRKSTCLQCKHRELWVKLSFSSDKQYILPTPRLGFKTLKMWTTSPQPAQGVFGIYQPQQLTYLKTQPLHNLAKRSFRVGLPNCSWSGAQVAARQNYQPQGCWPAPLFPPWACSEMGQRWWRREGGLWSASQQPAVQCCSARERREGEVSWAYSLTFT